MKKIFVVVFALLSLSYADAEDWELLRQGAGSNDNIERVHFIDARYGLMAGGSGISYTNDSGKTWTQGKKHNIMADSNIILKSNGRKRVCFSDVNTGWAVSSTESVVFKSADGGRNWNSAVSIDTSDFKYGAMEEILFPTPLVGYFFVAVGLGTVNYPYKTIVGKTTNGGVTWDLSQIDDFGGGYCGFFLNADIGWIVGHSSGDDCLLRTIDGGVTWESISCPHSVESIFFLNSDVGWIGGGGRVSKTSDGGKTWATYLTNRGSMKAIHFINENIGWTISIFSATNSPRNSILYTIDGGTSWTESILGNTQCGIFEPINMYFNSVTGWVVGKCGVGYRTQNYGGLQGLVSVKPVSRTRQGITPLCGVSITGRTLNVSSSGNTVYQVRIVDMRGKTAARFKASGNGNFSLAKIPAGRYILEAKTSVGTKTTTAIMVRR